MKKGTLNKLNTAVTKFVEHVSTNPTGKRAKNAAEKLIATFDAAREEI